MAASADTIRTYETFEIVWDRGSRWSNYDSAAQAQAIIDGSGQPGHVNRKTFEVRVTAATRHIYRPGFSERSA